MWTIFAGVAIFMTVIFIYNDIYCSKTHCDQQKYLNVTIPDNNDKSSDIS